MTSLWPPDLGVREVRDALGEGAETLAELFQGAGYRTYGVQSNGWLAATFGFHQGFDRYVDDLARPDRSGSIELAGRVQSWFDATPPVWNVRMVSWVPGSPID